MIKRIIVVTQSAIISTHLLQLCIKIDEKEETIPIEDLGVLLLENHQTTITNAALNALTENNCVIITCNSKHHPSGLLLPIAGNVLHTEVLRKQINATLPFKKNLWQQIIKAKIYNQALSLKNVKSNFEPLIYFSKKVISGDKNNLEGRAAAFYWENFFPKDLNFRRDVNEPGVNSLLNYGYSIIRAAVAKAIVSSGMHPALGLHHKNQYNPFCLADDLMEPFRPFVDLKVHHHFTDVNEVVLTPVVKKYLISVMFDDSFFGKERKPIQLAITQCVQNLVKCFHGESKKIIYPTINAV